VLGARHLERVLREYCFTYFNRARPHQGIGQRIPFGSAISASGGRRSWPSPCLAVCTTIIDEQREEHDCESHPRMDQVAGTTARCAAA
jgi:hypothetical protein